ncbi:MAG: hypothetical protein Q7S24_01155 [bacterium]|nr:hypothetical protein [bacterium]
MNENYKHDIIYLSAFFAVFSLAIVLVVILNAYPYLKNIKSNNPVVMASSTTDIAQIIDDFLVSAEEDIANTFTNGIKQDYQTAPPILEDISAKEINIGKYKIMLNEVEEYGQKKFNEARVMLGKKIIKEVEDDSIIVQKITFDKKDYYTIQRYTGGAHCCFVNHSLIYKNNVLSLGNTTLFGNSIGPSQENLFIKDHELYFYSYDDRLAYFNTSYSGSHIMFYPNIFRFDENKGWMVVNSEFKDRYAELAVKFDSYVAGLKDLWQRPDFQAVYPTEWLPWVIARAVHQQLAGQDDDIVWEQLKNDLDFFNTIDPTDVSFDKLKSDMIELMKPSREVMVEENW